MPQYNATGIVLRRLAYGETDNIVTLYTRENGRVSAIAKGARKASSRTASACEILTCARYNLASGKSLAVITQAEIKNAFPALRKDLSRLAHAQYTAELTDKFVADEDPHPQLFTLLRATLLLLERTADPATAARWFELRLLAETGFAPNLSACAACGEQVPDAAMRTDSVYALSASAGGVVCPLHAPAFSKADAPELTFDALDFLQHLSAHEIGSIRQLLDVAPPPRRSANLARLALRRYIRYRIDSDLRTLGFLDGLAG